MNSHRSTKHTKHLSPVFGLLPFLFITIASLAIPAKSQLIEVREYRGKEIGCAQSGLFSSVMPCGLEESFEQIFVGSVVAYTEVSDTEARLVLHPEEVFKGHSEGDVEASIIQLGCLDKVHTGDRWLVYLQRQESSGKLILWYASGSGPEKEEQQSIDLLRSLVQKKIQGAILGSVQRVDESKGVSNYSNLANHKVIATQQGTGKKFLTSTDANGDFRFTQLPAGTYHLKAEPLPEFWSEEVEVDLTPKSCFRTSFTLQPDTEISGRVTASDGTPVKSAQVILVPEPNPDGIWQSAFTDQIGKYAFHGLKPGQYLLGLHIEPEPSGPSSGPALYYPGVPLKRNALILDLGQVEKRKGIDHSLPPISRN